jgi:hypothetical protein
MKKKILSVSTVFTLLSVFAISCQNANETKNDAIASASIEEVVENTKEVEKPSKKVFDDFIYDVGPRFGSIKKSDVDNAKTIDTFFDEKELKKMESITSVSIIPFVKEERLVIHATGNTKKLNESQLKMFRDFGYSASFVVRVDFKEINEVTGEVEDSYTTPHLTIVPEKQATFVDGKEALKAFLKMSTEEVRKNVDPEKLKPAKLFFTVTKDGTIKNVHLDRPSGYPEVDKKMIELIKQVPGTWLPAENTKGEKVDQELVVSFGLMGC